MIDTAPRGPNGPASSAARVFGLAAKPAARKKTGAGAANIRSAPRAERRQAVEHFARNTVRPAKLLFQCVGGVERDSQPVRILSSFDTEWCGPCRAARGFAALAMGGGQGAFDSVPFAFADGEHRRLRPPPRIRRWVRPPPLHRGESRSRSADRLLDSPARMAAAVSGWVLGMHRRHALECEFLQLARTLPASRRRSAGARIPDQGRTRADRRARALQEVVDQRGMSALRRASGGSRIVNT